ncbi:Fungal lipase-like domain containing protein [Parasponia andersonii]|uniref:Fungal lipase-like domain containing protein n=1 Tax=Parasponia andersonii TaxID=3476 RepID=A0A2P5CDF1_PARAD|nr:Fungal lipase-like domain containing protein [Parasponia andersonii]
MASLSLPLNKTMIQYHIPSTLIPLNSSKTLFPGYQNLSIVTKTSTTTTIPFKTTCKSSSVSRAETLLSPDHLDGAHDHDDHDFNHHDHHDNQTALVYHEDDRPLSQIWREIQGANDWEGLLDPLNSHLRTEIIRYGEFAQACYDSFDFDPHSRYCGTCKYQGAHFFERLDMAHRGYDISRYLYATSNINLPNFFQRSKMSSVWSTHANWMGYVAVSTDESEVARLGRRDILIAWRGTVTYLEWICDLKDILRPAEFGPDPTVKMESGFYDLYTKKERGCKYCSFSAREQVLAEVKRLLEYYEGEEISITVTGHSLGAALALISAYDIAEVGLNDAVGRPTIPVTVYSFAGPRVGNLKFKERCDELGVKVLRLVNVHDVVPNVPGIIANEKLDQFQKYIEEAISFPWSYAHVGVELPLDHTQSPFLKPTKDPGSAHNLEAHLHLVDGYHGKGRKFRLVTKRDIALVNKNCDLLRGEYGVPPNWRQDENKGMVRNSDGRWVLPERPRLEGHPPDMAVHLEKVLNYVNESSSGSQQLGTT